MQRGSVLRQAMDAGAVYPSSLYVHIPFCRAKCAYCDFNSYAGLDDLHVPYMEALGKEMAQYGARWAGVPLRTIYIGGGTPTTLPFALLARLLEACHRHFHVLSEAEITIEANPGTVNRPTLAGLRQQGVTRLSLGVQSLDDRMLHVLGRIHTANQAVDTYLTARDVGYDNINIDLIYGLPGQSLAEWQRTLEDALALAPDHLSLYALTLHEETPLAREIRRGAWPALDDDLAADMYTWALHELETNGYRHYEISNWAAKRKLRSGHIEEDYALCHHNLTYWLDKPYIGLGAGAHSYLEQRRYWNKTYPEDYIRCLWVGQSPVEGEEAIDRATEMAEVMILGLRLMEGVSYERFAARFGCDLRDIYRNALGSLEGLGLLHVGPECVRLTERAYLLGNEVFERFLPG